MKVLWQINYETGLGADRWIVSGYKAAFEDLGHAFFFWQSHEDLDERLREVKPDILVISQRSIRYKVLPVLKTARADGTKVFIWVDSLFYQEPEAADILTHDDPGDVYHGETEEPWMERFRKETGKRYTVTPNAANHRLHFPTKPVKKYECDIAFLGANLPSKQEAFKTLLFPLVKRHRVRIYGPGWTFSDHVLRSLAGICRKAGWMKGNDWLSRKRISVPPEEENQLYSSAKVAINFHERGETLKTHVILNERTFKIPACGGFEICDFVPPLRKYFTEDEMVMAEDDGDWFEKIDYYLHHENERKKIQAAGTARARRDHTYLNRAEQMLKCLNLK